MSDNAGPIPAAEASEWRRRHANAIGDLTLSMVARGSGAPLALIANVLIARALGPQDLGAYMTLLSIGLMARGVAVYGIGPVVKREIASSSQQDRIAIIVMMARWAIHLSGRISILVGVGIVIWLAMGWGLPYSTWLQRLAIICIMLSATGSNIISSALAGLGMVPRSQSIDNLVKNGFLLAGIGFLILIGVRSSTSLLWLQVLSFGFAALLGTYWVSRTLSPISIRQLQDIGEGCLANKVRFDAWTKSAAHFFAMSMAHVILARLDVVMVNALSGSTQAGLYGAAARLGQFGGIVGMVWVAWLQPRMAQRYSSGNYRQLRSIMRIGFIGSTGMTTLMAALGYALAPRIVGLLGAGFEGAIFPFRLLIIGYAVWAICVPSYSALTMSGREALVSRIAWGRVGITLLASIPLVAELGAIGGALAWAGGLTLESISMIGTEFFTRNRAWLTNAGNSIRG